MVRPALARLGGLAYLESCLLLIIPACRTHTSGEPRCVSLQMRRAADRLLRTAKRTSVGRLCITRSPYRNPNRSQKYTGFRSVSSFSKNHGPFQTIQSTMYLRQFSAAAIVSIVASSLWYYRKEPDQKRELAGSPTTARGLPHLNPFVLGQLLGQLEP